MAKELVVVGPRKVEFREYETGSPGEGQVLVKTLYSAISHGTEMNIYRGTAPFFSLAREDGLFVEGEPTFKYPMTYGYEGVGEVTEVGKKVGKLKVGDIVAGAWHHCEMKNMNAAALARIPSGMEPEIGVFRALAGTALNSFLTSSVRFSESAVVFGVGVIGIFVVQICKLAGVEPIIAVDILDERLTRSCEFGADFTLNPLRGDVGCEVVKLTDGRGADVVMETSGSVKALHDAIRCGAVSYSRLVATGWYQGGAADLRLGEEFHHSGSHLGRGTCQILACNAALPPTEGRQWDRVRLSDTAFKLLVTGRLKAKELISHRIPFEEAAKAFELIDKHPKEVMKVILTF